jgi:hypothetical protein
VGAFAGGLAGPAAEGTLVEQLQAVGSAVDGDGELVAAGRDASL